MIVGEITAVPSLLDRLLQVDRIASLEPLPALGERATDTSGARAALPSAPLPIQALSAAQSATTATIVATLPLGQEITARVVDVPVANHVVAEVGDLQIALAWPASGGAPPQPGQDVTLRVLAHHPMLLFQDVEAVASEAPDDAGDVHWSSDALRLQAMATGPTAAPSIPGTVRFDTPILRIEVEALPAEPDAEASKASPAPVRSGADRTTSAVGFDRSSDWHLLPPPLERAGNVAFDDAIVGHAATVVNGIKTPLAPHLQDTLPTTLPFSPLVLQGPAWDGQPMELIVRRERDDEELDNPVLDHWCGEVTIDLPHLGRVAGHLSFSMQGLRLRIEGDDEHSVMTMSAASSELAAALAHADLRVAGLTVAGRSADATRSERRAGMDLGNGIRHG